MLKASQISSRTPGSSSITKIFNILGYGQIENFIDDEDLDEEDLVSCSSNNDDDDDDDTEDDSSEEEEEESNQEEETKKDLKQLLKEKLRK